MKNKLHELRRITLKNELHELRRITRIGLGGFEKMSTSYKEKGVHELRQIKEMPKLFRVKKVPKVLRVN